MDLGDLKTANDALTGGYWIDGLPDLGDIRLHVLPARAPKVQKALGLALRACMERDADENVTPEADSRIQSEVYASTALLGWENITDGGEPVPFSVEKAKELLRVEIFDAALRFAVFQAGTLYDQGKERAAKN